MSFACSGEAPFLPPFLCRRDREGPPLSWSPALQPASPAYRPASQRSRLASEGSVRFPTLSLVLIGCRCRSEAEGSAALAPDSPGGAQDSACCPGVSSCLPLPASLTLAIFSRAAVSSPEAVSEGPVADPASPLLPTQAPSIRLATGTSALVLADAGRAEERSQAAHLSSPAWGASPPSSLRCPFEDLAPSLPCRLLEEPLSRCFRAWPRTRPAPPGLRFAWLRASLPGSPRRLWPSWALSPPPLPPLLMQGRRAISQ